MRISHPGLGLAVLLLLAPFLPVVWFASAAHALTIHTVSSPNGLVNLTVSNNDEGTLTYTVTASGQAILGRSPLGIKTSANDFTTGLSFVGESRTTIDQSYQLPAGTKPSYRDHANEMTLTYAAPLH